MKKIFGLLMILMVGSITHASDNRSAPNVFSSGSTISSSQMNENFNFLASEIREKDVNCNNGETITDAINEGYNSLTIYGTCDGGIMVYMFDPNPFGVSFSQLSNKPIGHLIIKGGEANRASKIINTTGGFNSMVTSKGYLQLYNLTFNDELSVNDGSMLDATEITYEVTVTGGKNKIGANGNSQLSLSKSTINSEVGLSDSSLGVIKESNINIPSNNEALYVSEVSHLELEENSVINGRISAYGRSNIDINEVTINCNSLDTCIHLNNSSIELDQVNISLTSVNHSGLNIYHGSKATLRNSTISSDGTTESISVYGNSIIEISDSNVTSNDGRAIYISNNSRLNAYNTLITRSTNSPTVAIERFSTAEIGGSTSISDFYCYDPYVSIANYENLSFTSNINCNGYEKKPSQILFNFTDFGSVNCTSMQKNDLDENECQEFGWNVNPVCDPGMPSGCWFDKENGYWVHNSCGGSDNFMDATYARAIVCK